MRLRPFAQFKILFIMSVLLVGVSLPARTDAQSSGWSRPSEISSAFGGWFPDVIADRFGRVHVVWAGTLIKDTSDVYDVVMYRSRDGRSDWIEAVDIASLVETNGESYATRPVLMIDHEDQFHLSYRNSSGVLYTQPSSRELATGANWATPQVITSYGYFSEVLEDLSGTLHLLYTENFPTSDCANCFHVLHRLSNNHGMSWSLPEDVSRQPTGAAKPSVLVDDQNRLHVVWESGFGGDLGQLNGPASILYSRYEPSTARWSQTLELSPTDTDARNVGFQVDRNGRLIVVYLTVEDNRINFRRSSNSGVTWSTPVPIAGVLGAYVTPLDRMDMAMDSGGDLHLILVGRLEDEENGEGVLETRSVLHLSWDGSAWSQPEVVANYVGDVPEWPSIAVSEGNVLNVAWFVRDAASVWQSETGHYTVWYASRVSDSPSVTPVPIPTGTSTASGSAPSIAEGNGIASQTGSGQDEAQPTFEPIEHGLVQESDLLILIGKSLIPAILFVAGSLAFLSFRRR